MVGYVFGLRPRFFKLKNFVLNQWKKFRLLAVLKVEDNLFIFNFDSKANKIKALHGGPLSFDNHPIIVKQWHPRLKLSIYEISRVPIWVKFPHLLLEFWTTKLLSKIVSICGSSLFSDQRTI